MNKLRAQLHRQVALNGLNGMDPSPNPVPGLDQGHSPPGLCQRPGGRQTGNSRANHNGVEVSALLFARSFTAPPK